MIVILSENKSFELTTAWLNKLFAGEFLYRESNYLNYFEDLFRQRITVINGEPTITAEDIHEQRKYIEDSIEWYEESADATTFYSRDDLERIDILFRALPVPQELRRKIEAQQLEKHRQYWRERERLIEILEKNFASTKVVGKKEGQASVVSSPISEPFDANNALSELYDLCFSKIPDLKRVEYLLSKKLDLNYRFGWDKLTCLMRAAMSNNKEVVQLLLKYNADKTLTEAYGKTADQLTTDPNIRNLIEQYPTHSNESIRSKRQATKIVEYPARKMASLTNILQKQSKPFPLADLAADVLAIVLSKLSPKDRFLMQRTCKLWKEIISNPEFAMNKEAYITVNGISKVLKDLGKTPRVLGRDYQGFDRYLLQMSEAVLTSILNELDKVSYHNLSMKFPRINKLLLEQQQAQLQAFALSIKQLFAEAQAKGLNVLPLNEPTTDAQTENPLLKETMNQGEIQAFYQQCRRNKGLKEEELPAIKKQENPNPSDRKLAQDKDEKTMVDGKNNLQLALMLSSFFSNLNSGNRSVNTLPDAKPSL